MCFQLDKGMGEFYPIDNMLSKILKVLMNLKAPLSLTPSAGDLRSNVACTNSLFPVKIPIFCEIPCPMIFDLPINICTIAKFMWQLIFEIGLFSFCFTLFYQRMCNKILYYQWKFLSESIWNRKKLFIEFLYFALMTAVFVCFVPFNCLVII